MEVKSLLSEQANKIEEVLSVLRANFGETYADEINYFGDCQANLEQSCD